MNKTMNFSGGPGALPASVLRETSIAIDALPETGLSVLGMSHRSDWFRGVLDEAERNLRVLLDIPGTYHVLFMQGGSSLQFSMLPMNFLRSSGKHAEYIVSGYWSAKAPVEARHEGATRVVWDGSAQGYRRLPAPAELNLAPDAAYLHYVSNETVEGLEFANIPGLHEVPLVCDMSSNLLAAPLDIDRYAMIYAHAQKNLGPAGVTLVILRDEFAQRATHALPTLLDYRTHIQSRSLYNTPPVFAIYVLMLVTRWLRDEIGGVENMAAINRAKSERLYRALDAEPDFYCVHGERACRSTMNVAFRLPDTATQAQFLDDARRAGLHGLEGHRSIGGLRASLYNAVTPEAVGLLSEWLGEFRRLRG
ncbi:3-phosphoserine/phosphohydroxythreonine transaminase [Caballeronia sordidicola]|uniref:Phosphoserine aminotransferase n=1 Tax=Caballeronia sordidicola TaxID=196367 RepID=A0A226WKC8_CABSO|nr:3-phosphoserine/phosphohydroxythreonine transaminase [Caballeronia sordidicola]OXC71646.1 Phosphoserine aminotransferase [Caballeronia sordidicola]